MSSQARKQRRSYERMLKKYDIHAYKEYKSGVKSRGAESHREFTELNEQKLAESAEHRLAKYLDSLKENGASEKEIKNAETVWVSRMKVWGSDERPTRLREIKKQMADDKNRAK